MRNKRKCSWYHYSKAIRHYSFHQDLKDFRNKDSKNKSRQFTDNSYNKLAKNRI